MFVNTVRLDVWLRVFSLEKQAIFNSVGIEKMNGRRRSWQGSRTETIKYDKELSHYFIFHNNIYIFYGFRIIIGKPKNHL